jgi:hypothetical protein
MNWRGIGFIAFGSMCLGGASYAQPSMPPAFDRAQNFAIAIQQDAEATAKRADAMWQQNRFVQVMQEYEGFLGRAQSVPEATRYYPVLMVLAGAHLEIAIARISMPEFQTRFHDEYRRLANAHLDRTLDLLRSANLAAAAAVPNAADNQNFLCHVFLRLAATVALRGIVNNVPADLDFAIKNYERSAACNSDYRSTIQFLRGLERNMTHSPLGSDAIVAFIAKFIGSTSKPGKYIAPFIEAAYDSYQKHQSPLPNRLQR